MYLCILSITLFRSIYCSIYLPRHVMFLNLFDTFNIFGGNSATASSHYHNQVSFLFIFTSKSGEMIQFDEHKWMAQPPIGKMASWKADTHSIKFTSLR